TDTASPSVATLSLHDALPILACCWAGVCASPGRLHGLSSPLRPDLPSSSPFLRRMVPEDVDIIADEGGKAQFLPGCHQRIDGVRSEEHTSELQSRENIVCRLL